MHARVMSEALLCMDYISTQRLPQRQKKNTNVWAAVTLNSLSFLKMPAIGRVKVSTRVENFNIPATKEQPKTKSMFDKIEPSICKR